MQRLTCLPVTEKTTGSNPVRPANNLDSSYIGLVCYPVTVERRVQLPLDPPLEPVLISTFRMTRERSLVRVQPGNLVVSSSVGRALINSLVNFGVVAHLGEHLISIQEVASSILVDSTKGNYSGAR